MPHRLLGIVAVALMILAGVAAPATSVFAQDGTPGATPAASTSAADLCPGTGFAPGIVVTLALADIGAAPDSGESTVDALAQRAAAISPQGCGVATSADGTIAVTLAEGSVPNVDVMLATLTSSAQLEIVELGTTVPQVGDRLESAGGSGGAGTPVAGYPVIITGSEIVGAEASVDQNGANQVTVTLAPDVADRFAAYTAEHVGTTLAILLNGVVISTPVIQGEIAGGTLVIAGNFDAAGTEALATQLQSGALQTPVTVVSVGLAPAPSDATPTAAPAGTPAAGEVAGVETFTIASAQHTSFPVDYAQSPPVGGMHNPAWQNCGYYDAPIGNENGVHSLEHGVIWITYQPDLSAAEVEALRQVLLVNDRLIISPYPGLDAPIVLSSWDRQLRLDSIDDPRLFEFITAYQEKAPEPGASCEGRVGTPA